MFQATKIMKVTLVGFGLLTTSILSWAQDPTPPENPEKDLQQAAANATQNPSAMNLQEKLQYLEREVEEARKSLKAVQTEFQINPAFKADLQRLRHQYNEAVDRARIAEEAVENLHSQYSVDSKEYRAATFWYEKAAREAREAEKQLDQHPYNKAQSALVRAKTQYQLTLESESSHVLASLDRAMSQTGQQARETSTISQQLAQVTHQYELNEAKLTHQDPIIRKEARKNLGDLSSQMRELNLQLEQAKIAERNYDRIRKIEKYFSDLAVQASEGNKPSKESLQKLLRLYRELEGPMKRNFPTSVSKLERLVMDRAAALSAPTQSPSPLPSKGESAGHYWKPGDPTTDPTRPHNLRSPFQRNPLADNVLGPGSSVREGGRASNEIRLPINKPPESTIFPGIPRTSQEGLTISPSTISASEIPSTSSPIGRTLSKAGEIGTKIVNSKVGRTLGTVARFGGRILSAAYALGAADAGIRSILSDNPKPAAVFIVKTHPGSLIYGDPEDLSPSQFQELLRNRQDIPLAMGSHRESLKFSPQASPQSDWGDKSESIAMDYGTSTRLSNQLTPEQVAEIQRAIKDAIATPPNPKSPYDTMRVEEWWPRVFGMPSPTLYEGKSVAEALRSALTDNIGEGDRLVPKQTSFGFLLSPNLSIGLASSLK